MALFEIDPLTDARWASYIASNPPGSSVFHTPGWLRALHSTYGYRPRALFTGHGGLAFCEVKSWATGKRLVSLPFSDYCDPLGDNLPDLLHGLQQAVVSGGFRYAEVRPGCKTTSATDIVFAPSQNFYRHAIDLRPGPEALYRGLHKDSIERKIRRAEKERLQVEEWSPSAGKDNDSLLRDFYGLFLLTRRRHGYPPPPLRWFRNVLASMGGDASLLVARKPDGGPPVASMLLLRHGSTVYYKYGASDEQFHAMGGMQMLFWRTMLQACEAGRYTSLDLGRSDIDGSGLIQFKERLGAARTEISYLRFPAPSPRAAAEGGLSRRIFSRLPDRLLTLAGELLYPHIG